MDNKQKTTPEPEFAWISNPGDTLAYPQPIDFALVEHTVKTSTADEVRVLEIGHAHLPECYASGSRPIVSP
jgi:hypothetical protein